MTSTATPDTPDDRQRQLLLRLLKLASLINRPMQDAVADPSALSLNELRIVMCLAHEGPCAGRDITALMGMPAMNVSRAVASLHARGWIENVVDPRNRRRRPVRLSDAGQRGYAAMEPEIAGVAGRVLGSLGARDLDDLDRATTEIVARLGAWRPERED